MHAHDPSADEQDIRTMAARIRTYDWAATSLGAIDCWPQSLRTAVELMLCAAQPCYIGWGPDTLSLYNDAYLPILGAKHPDALGQPFREVFSEAWQALAPMFAATMAGHAQHFADMPLALSGREGCPTSWFTFSWTPLRDESGQVAGFYCAATETTARVLAERALLETRRQQQILFGELQHRVRNSMAIIRSIVARSRHGASSVDDYAHTLQGRLAALARVQSLITRASGSRVDLAELVREELDATVGADEGRWRLHGDVLPLDTRAAEVLTLAVHELATNALKHGAFATTSGRLDVRWHRVADAAGDRVRFEWQEQGVVIAPAEAAPRRGFGSELIQSRVPYELKGRARMMLDPGGMHCILEFPWRTGGSAFDISVPAQVPSRGAAEEVSGETLRGHRVLVVEDDYYLAGDLAQALLEAGAEVLGPCRDDVQARLLPGAAAAGSAVLDINLGSARSFVLARELRASGVNCLFVSGYAAAALPRDLAGVPLFQKPVDPEAIVHALGRFPVSRVQQG